MADRKRIWDEAEDSVSDRAGHRFCAASRAELPIEELIRFVAGPDGVIVPDLARKLPGRGVWVTATRDVVQKAVSGNVFSRSLKRPVKADTNLPDLIETLLAKRVGEALSLANKAGLVTTGYAKVDALVGSGEAIALLHAADAADGDYEKLRRKFMAVRQARGRNAPLVTSLSTPQMSLAMGRANVVHAALTSGTLADKFLSEAERLMRYQSGSSTSWGQDFGATDGLDRQQVERNAND